MRPRNQRIHSKPTRAVRRCRRAEPPTDPQPRAQAGLEGHRLRGDRRRYRRRGVVEPSLQGPRHAAQSLVRPPQLGRAGWLSYCEMRSARVLDRGVVRAQQ